MLGSFLFLLLGSLLGFVLLRLVRSPLKVEEQLVWGIPIGTVGLTSWTFLWALLLGYQNPALIVATASSGALIFYYFNRDANHTTLLHDWQDFRQRLTRPEIIAWLIVLCPWLIYTIITVPYLMYFREGNLIAGWINTWGDWAAHLRSSTFFADQPKLSLENPLLANEPFHYPYLSSYLSALLQRLGLTIDRALTWPTLVLFGSLPAVLYIFGRRLTGSRAAGVIFTYIVLLAGGMGVYYLVKDLTSGVYFWEASSYSPKLYTDVRLDGWSVNDGLWFMNFIMSEFFPQRAFLAGIGIALYIIYSAWNTLNVIAIRQLAEKQSQSLKIATSAQSLLAMTEKVDRKNLLFAGVLFGLLPLIHTHSFVALGIAIPTLWLFITLTSKKPLPLIPLLQLLIPAAMIGFSLFFLFVFDFEQSQSFLQPLHWWVPQQNVPVNPLLYWLRNAGPIIILGLASIALRRFRPLLTAGLVLFMIANFINFQPWHYDNLKILTYWYILWAVPVALLIAKLPELTMSSRGQSPWRSLLKKIATSSRQVGTPRNDRKKLLIRTVQIILILLLTGAGLADALMVTVSTRSGIQLSSKDDLAFASLVKQKTAEDPTGLIVAAPNHDHPLSLSSGRRLYLGYEGWLWSYGVDAGNRASEVQEMYQASPRGLALLQEKNISYIALGPQERYRFKPNETALTMLFPLVVSYKNYKLLRVPE